MHRPVVQPSTAPATMEEFGAGLRALRSVGLRRMVARQEEGGPLYLSKSQLARYEVGACLPPLEHASHLDHLYEAGGWVEMSLRSLWRPRWNPWLLEHGAASRHHAGAWPAEYGGVVWIKVRPAPEAVDTHHLLRLEWGPWGRDISCQLGEVGIVFLTGKAIDRDGISRVCNLTAEQPVYVLYGSGDNLDGETVIDIRRGWTKVNL